MVLARRAADKLELAREACDRHSVLGKWGVSACARPATGPGTCLRAHDRDRPSEGSGRPALSQLTCKELARELDAAAPGRYDVGRLERWSKSRLLAKLRELRQEARDSEHGGAGGSGADNESNAGDSQHGGAGGSDVDNESNAGAGAIGSDEEDELCSSDGFCALCMEEM